ncbi:Uncharacterised protein [Mycobacteroides abscessus subsp. abscessus]|nr:Uncharacterised protein [Mycobacteroides abscessus subsp. abscessus]
MADEISPSSTRNPRIFTCSSARPTNSTSPPALRRARSPDRYIRCPGAKGSAMKRCAVRAGAR